MVYRFDSDLGHTGHRNSSSGQATGTVLKLQYADSIREIKTLKGLNFEALRGELKGYHSVRVDKQYRLILTIGKDEKITFVDVITVHDLSKHYQ